jgi:hypothetical protein
MITICWAAKGGSGTTVVAAARAIAVAEPTLLVDLDGDLPAALGVTDPDRPGVHDWLASDAAADRLAGLEIPLGPTRALLPTGRAGRPVTDRWPDLATHLRLDRREVIVDAGTGAPPAALLDVADHAWLVTRACYLALRAAVQLPCRPTGVVLVDEPGRALTAADVEAALGAPVIATVLLDPAIARAVDAGLLVSRLPSAFRRCLRRAA